MANPKSTIDPEIVEAIERAPASDPRKLAAQLTTQFGRVIPSSMVVQVRGTMVQSNNITRAKERASETLDENLDIMGETKRELLELFRDPSIPLKMRLEISKELRQWTNLETDTAGIKDGESNTLFVIDPMWNTLATLEDIEDVT